jgi:ABC-type dipeptide/oligopeptide/nickel transport system permease subunit
MRLQTFAETLGHRRIAVAGIVLFCIPLAMAIFAGWITPFSPNAILGAPYEKPSVTHILGTDDIGKDLFSQLVYGSRTSLTVGILSTVIAMILGVLVGMPAGFLGGWLDEVLMRFTDVVLTFPYLIFIIVLIAYVGPSIWNMIICIGVLAWTTIARMVRSQVLSLKTQLYVEAATALGATNRYIMLRYILPSLTVLLIPVAVLTVVDGILTEAGLSFLGLGDLTQPSWGLILFYAAARGGFVKGSWWWIVPPGLMITITSLGLIFTGQALDEILNPRKQRF